MCSLSKEQSILSGRQFKMDFLFQNYAPFLLRLFILYQAPHSLALATACSATVWLLHDNRGSKYVCDKI